jgi:hypothetical protein
MMDPSIPNLLPLKKINQILSRHYGSKRALALDAGVHFSLVTLMFSGKRVHLQLHALASKHAEQYLIQERDARIKTEQGKVAARIMKADLRIA